MYISKTLRKIAAIFLLLLPMQHFPSNLMSFLTNVPLKNLPSWTRVFSYTDEISFIVFILIVFTFWTLQPATFKVPRLPLTKWLLAFVIFAFINGMAKQIPIAQATFGVYDLVKNIVIIYLFAMMAFRREEFISLLRSLIIVGLVLSAVGMFGIMLAFALGHNVEPLAHESGRFIPYQTHSLAGFGKANYLGVYATLLFFLSYSLYGPLMRFSQFNIFLLVIFTVSRQAWMSFLAMFALFKKKTILLVAMPILFLAIVIKMGVKAELDPKEYFRLFVFVESLKILQEHPLTGLGPGMFASLASVIWQSPIYKDWPPLMMHWMFTVRAIDTFWPIVWGEQGLIGFSLYAGGLLSVFLHLKRLAAGFNRLADTQFVMIGRTLQWFMVAIVIMGFAGGLNMPFVTYTYSALIGIYVTLYDEAAGAESIEAASAA